ncbi:MAG TPA: SRPBCC domain-containing protein [Ramlibacter sp.]|nr:SRPBCC domain-containing protein [Ramlibacter sp.]
MAQTIVRVTHRYNVSAPRVFDAWLTPVLAARFLFVTRTGIILHCEIDPQIGGSFIVTDRRPVTDGEESVFEARHRGVYVEIDRPGRLAFDLGIEPSTEPPTRVTIDVVTMGPNLCDLVLEHDLGDSDNARANYDLTRQSWTNMLAQLDKVLNTRTWGFKVPGSA